MVQMILQHRDYQQTSRTLGGVPELLQKINEVAIQFQPLPPDWKSDSSCSFKYTEIRNRDQSPVDLKVGNCLLPFNVHIVQTRGRWRLFLDSDFEIHSHKVQHLRMAVEGVTASTVKQSKIACYKSAVS